MPLIYLVFILLSLGTACSSQEKKQTPPMAQSTNLSTFYIGTYTRTEGHVDGNAEGIYKIQVNESTGEIKDKKVVAQLINPSFLAYAPNKKYLYAVSELAHTNEPTGFLYAYKIGKDTLELINQVPTDGQAPCHISIDQTGKFAFVANYLGGGSQNVSHSSGRRISGNGQKAIYRVKYAPTTG